MRFDIFTDWIELSAPSCIQQRLELHAGAAPE